MTTGPDWGEDQMTDQTDRAWRAEYARRFVTRALLRPPWPPAVYVRITDAQIDALPESHRDIALAQRDLLDAMAALAEGLQRTDTRDEAE